MTASQLTAFPNGENRVENTTRNVLRGVWTCGQTWFLGFDTSSHPKLKLRENEKIKSQIHAN